MVLVALATFGGAGPAFADHDYRDCDWDGNCGGQEYDQNYGSRDDRNRNRNRERGAFSPGPFDDSPVTIGPICMPNSTCTFEPPPEDQPPQ